MLDVIFLTTDVKQLSSPLLELSRVSVRASPLAPSVRLSKQWMVALDNVELEGEVRKKDCRSERE